MNSHDSITPALTFKNVTWVCGYIGCCKSTLYRMVVAGDFPKPVLLTARHKAWRLSDVIAWAESRGEAA